MKNQMKTQKVGQIGNINLANLDGDASHNDELHIWFDDEEGKWFSCFSGTLRGIYSESDDEQSGDTEEQAWITVIENYVQWHTPSNWSE